MIPNLHIYKSPEELAEAFAGQLLDWVNDFNGNTFHLAISGGKTPEMLFNILSQKYADSRLWQKVHFWWVDERMVPPNHPESNYGAANRLLFSQIIIPEENIHRIKGENDPDAEALSYSGQIQDQLILQNVWPIFDLILLGMGNDGHTASIFPDQLQLINSRRICEVAFNPLGQKRITLTGSVINHAAKVCFIVTGISKADRLADLEANLEQVNPLPAAHIHPVTGNLDWYVDQSAAKLLV